MYQDSKRNMVILGQIVLQFSEDPCRLRTQSTITSNGDKEDALGSHLSIDTF